MRGDVAYHMSSLSDPVLMREDGRVIYTLASVVDDIDHGITAILRGEDHVTNSAAQIQLFEALGATPPQMGHLALLAGADGEGLSKRLGSLSVHSCVKRGLLAPALGLLLARIGTSVPVVPQASLADIIAGFDITSFGRATRNSRLMSYTQINARVLQQLAFAAVAERLAEAGLEAVDERFWLAVRGNITTLQEAGDWWAVCHQPLTPEIEDEDCWPQLWLRFQMVRLARYQLVRMDKAVSAQTGAKGKGKVYVHAASQSVDRTRIWPGCRHFVMLHVARSGCAAAGRTNRLKTQMSMPR